MTATAMVVRDLEADEARLIIDRIRHYAGLARHDIQRLHDGRGWLALGYPTWEACLAAEFDIERRTVFAQLQAATIERELQSADVSTDGVSKSNLVELGPLQPSERVEVARELDLSTVSTRVLRQTIKDRRTERVRDARRELLANAPAGSTNDNWHVYQADAGRIHAHDFTPYRDVDLFVTSPPYGLGLDGSDVDDDGGTWGEYLVKGAAWAAAMYEVANPDHGRICLNIPLDRSKGSREAVYADWVWLMRRAGWKYAETIVWKEGNTSNHQARGSVASPNAPHAVAPVELILVMYRGQWPLGEPSRLADISEMDWIDWLSTTWTFAGEHRYRVGHMAPFPEELARRCILLYSFPGALIADPFVGSGTTAVAALHLGRRFVGSDIDPECVELTRARVAREVPA